MMMNFIRGSFVPRVSARFVVVCRFTLFCPGMLEPSSFRREDISQSFIYIPTAKQLCSCERSLKRWLRVSLQKVIDFNIIPPPSTLKPFLCLLFATRALGALKREKTEKKRNIFLASLFEEKVFVFADLRFQSARLSCAYLA